MHIPMLVYVLVVGHFIADFVCQSNWQALNKAKRWDALAQHVLGYITALAAVVSIGLLLFAPDKRGGAVVTFFTVNAVAHFAQDAITSRITSRLWFIEFQPHAVDGYSQIIGGLPVGAMRDTGTRHWFFVVIGADQLLHYITLFATAGWWML